MRNISRISSLLALVSIGVFCDRYTKIFFENTPDISLFWDILMIRGVYNTGVAFSFSIPRMVLGALTMALVVGIGYQYIKVEFAKNSRLLDTWYSLLFAGGISHLYDRMVFGQVFDFIALKHFAIFNVADMMISIGVGLILWFYLLYGRTR